jgi:hypothetical protein
MAYIAKLEINKGAGSPTQPKPSTAKVESNSAAQSQDVVSLKKENNTLIYKNKGLKREIAGLIIENSAIKTELGTTKSDSDSKSATILAQAKTIADLQTKVLELEALKLALIDSIDNKLWPLVNRKSDTIRTLTEEILALGHTNYYVMYEDERKGIRLEPINAKAGSGAFSIKDDGKRGTGNLSSKRVIGVYIESVLVLPYKLSEVECEIVIKSDSDEKPESEPFQYVKQISDGVSLYRMERKILLSGYKQGTSVAKRVYLKHLNRNSPLNFVQPKTSYTITSTINNKPYAQIRFYLE